MSYHKELACERDYEYRLIVNDDGSGKAIVKSAMVAIDECKGETQTQDCERKNVSDCALN